MKGGLKYFSINAEAFVSLYMLPWRQRALSQGLNFYTPALPHGFSLPLGLLSEAVLPGRNTMQATYIIFNFKVITLKR